MVTQENFDSLRNELSVKSKNGLDFTSAASIVWLSIAFIWTLNTSSYNKSVLTFIVGGFMLPLAFLFSKILKTSWKIKDNPLEPLGLWLNFAQLFYFPFLVFVLIKMPDYFIMVYAIITGGHFFPYSWYYKTPWYAIFAGLIVIGALFLGLLLPVDKMFLLPVCLSLSLVVLTILLWIDARKKASK
jgi:hypothetical protein